MGMNYCPFCGARLVENAKFCSQCGKPISDVQNGEDQEKETVQQAPEVVDTLEPQTTSPRPDPIHTIKIGEYDLQVTESVIAYNKVRSYFVDYAEQSRDKFGSLYDNEVRDLETLYDKALPAIIEESTNAISFAVSVLERYGLVMEPDEFIRIAKENIHLGGDLHEYVETAEQLDNFTQRLHSYRARNRSGNIQWQGGGFGLKDAIGGALMAGALNLATDAVRGVGHAVVDSADRARLKKLQIDIYKSRDHKKHLGKVLYGFCMSLFDPAVRLLEEKSLIVHPPFNIEKGIGPITEAFDLVDNPYAREDDYKKALELTLQGMPYDPYFPLPYLTLYKIPLIDNADVLKIVKFFGVEDGFAPKVMEYEQDAWNNFMATPEESEEDLARKITEGKKLNNKCLYVHVSLSGLEKKRKEIIKKEKEAAAKREEERRRQEENNKLFLQIQKLPEQDLEQLHAKCNQLSKLISTPKVKKELNRITAKIEKLTEQEQRVKEHSDFLAAFSNANLSPKKIAKKLVGNIIFQEIYSQLTRDLTQAKELFQQKYCQEKSSYHIALRETLSFANSPLAIMQKNFAPFSETEVPIMYVYYTDPNHAGLVLTNQKIYIKGGAHDSLPYSFSLNEVYNISVDDSSRNIFGQRFWKVSVNETPSFILFEDKVLEQLSYRKFIHMLYFFIYYCLFLAVTENNHTESLFADVLKEAGMSQKGLDKNIADDLNNGDDEQQVKQSYLREPLASNGKSSQSTSKMNCQSQSDRINTLTHIKELCVHFLACHDTADFSTSNALITGLNIDAKEIYLAHDDTLFKSGKNGFAITSSGVYCRDMMESKAVHTTFDELRSAKQIYRKSDYTYADKKLLSYFSGKKTTKEDIKDLFQAIWELLQ